MTPAVMGCRGQNTAADDADASTLPVFGRVLASHMVQNQLRMRFSRIVRMIDTSREVSRHPGEHPNT
jgi:hypothetical protein